MKHLAIVGMCILAAVVYGIVHDQITARVCVEYFTIGHPLIFATDSPTLLGLGWGIVATWWVGLVLGLGLAVAARSGKQPRLRVRALVRPILYLLGWMAGSALLAGVVGYGLGWLGILTLLPGLAARIPADRLLLFQADAWAHAASYVVGFFGGCFLIANTWKVRGIARPRSDDSPSLPTPS
jgi:hypothetical protein